MHCKYGICNELTDINPQGRRSYHYCAKHRLVRKEQKKLEYLKNKKNYNEKNLARYHNLRRKFFEMYGNQCACCGENHYMFLSLDHINGGGNKHRGESSSYKIYGQAVKTYQPDKYQVLCYNCNFAKSDDKECPHATLEYTLDAEYF